MLVTVLVAVSTLLTASARDTTRTTEGTWRSLDAAPDGRTREQGLMPTTEGGLDFKMNMTIAMDGSPGHEHSLPLMPLDQDGVELFAKSGITYTPALRVSYGGPWSDNHFYEHYDIHDMRRFIPHAGIEARAERCPWFRVYLQE